MASWGTLCFFELKEVSKEKGSGEFDQFVELCEVRLLLGGLVEVRVVILHFGTSSPQYEDHEFEQLKDCISLSEGVFLNKLLSQSRLYLFEDLTAEDQVDSGLSDGQDILL